MSCIIDGTDLDLGKIGRAPQLSHSFSGTGIIKLVAKLDNGTPFITKEFNESGTFTITIPSEVFNSLEVGTEHTITIIVSSSETDFAVRTYTFTKTVWFPEKGDTLKEVLVKGLGQVNETITEQHNRISNKLTECGIEHNSKSTLKELVDEIEEKLGEPTPYPIYTVVIDLDNPDPKTRCTYADDAIGITSASGSNLGGWENKFPYSAIKPCVFDSGTYTPSKLPKAYVKPNNYRQWLDSTTAITSTDDVMVEFPKFYYRVKKNGRYLSISICEVQATKEFVNYSHLKTDGTLASRIYIGAYLGYYTSSKLYSQYGKTPNRTTWANLRTYAKSRGAQLTTYSMYSVFQILYVIAYRDTQAHAQLGTGYKGQSSIKATGGKDTSGMTSPGSSSTQMKLFGIEDMWGNLQCSLDGFTSDSSGIYIGYKDFNNTASGYIKVSNRTPLNAMGTIKDVLGIPEAPFHPISFTDQSGKYFSDKSWDYDAVTSSTTSNYQGSGSDIDTLFSLSGSNKATVEDSGSIYYSARLAFVPNY